MGRINVLSPLVANMIAAGEVLERPASAVKELIENSLDAGADRIIVEIENGGRSLIRITDNGCGMSKEDAQSCFLRHATSKIKSPEDLENIGTMGFRGEALASIAAVSKIVLTTRQRDEIEGTAVRIEAGEIKSVSEAGCGAGTSIEIRDLFFNTPARLKFLKSEATEAAQITEAVEKFIIVRPDVSVKLIKNGREALYSAGDNDSFSNLTNIFRKETTDNLKEISYQAGGISVTGYIGNSKLLKPNRKNQSFFVNGRAVRNRIFYAAVDEALKGRIAGGMHPFAIIMLNIDPSLTDVNVHPTKAEIKFADDRIIYMHIKEAVSSSFRIEGMEPRAEKNEKPAYEEQSFIPSVSTGSSEAVPFGEAAKNVIKETPYNQYYSEVEINGFSALKLVPVKSEKPAPAEPEKKFVQAEKGEAEPEKKAETVKTLPVDYKIIGQLFDTYVIIEREDKMYLLDQHAAHERLIYDKLKRERESSEIITQPLLAPYILNVSPAEHAAVTDNKELFDKMGFEIDDFGDGAIAVRGIPFTLSQEDISGYISEVADMLLENKTAMLTVKQEKALAALACKAAIKGNNRFSEFELSELVENVICSQTANTCPHGRPLFTQFDKKTIDRQFGRT